MVSAPEAALAPVCPAHQRSPSADVSVRPWSALMLPLPRAHAPGGYGGNANEAPKYSFEYPEGWKSEVPSKVRKGRTDAVPGWCGPEA